MQAIRVESLLKTIERLTGYSSLLEELETEYDKLISANKNLSGFILKLTRTIDDLKRDLNQ